MEDKVTLDRKTFKVLASDTRVEILKQLDTRRMTLSELSKKLGMSVSTVKEHLDDLQQAQLITKKEEGHKWKYYELTGKGKKIINPYEKKVFIVLAISAIAAIFGGNRIIGDMMPGPLMGAVGVLEAEPIVAVHSTLPYLELALLVVGTLVFGFCLGYLFFKKKKNTL